MSYSDFCHRAVSCLNPDISLPEPRDGLKPAAVLVPVIGRDSGASVLLTIRPEAMADHAGQIAFPGGKIDTVDTTLAAAALREAREEVGLEPERARILGRSEDIRTSTGFHIFPVVATVEKGFVPRPHPREVADVFEVPLDFLMQSDNCLTRRVPWHGTLVTSSVYDYQGRFIWGATARIIRTLSALLYEE